MTLGIWMDASYVLDSTSPTQPFPISFHTTKSTAGTLLNLFTAQFPSLRHSRSQSWTKVTEAEVPDTFRESSNRKLHHYAPPPPTLSFIPSVTDRPPSGLTPSRSWLWTTHLQTEVYLNAEYVQREFYYLDDTFFNNLIYQLKTISSRSWEKTQQWGEISKYPRDCF